MRAEGPVLMVRADANVAIATGHVMRCVALAQAWQDVGGQAVFVMADSTPAIARRLRSEEIEVVPIEPAPGSAADVACTAELGQSRDAAWVVVDGYHFHSDYQQGLKRAGLRVLFVDDNGHAGHYSADLILNQNAHASESLYQNRESYTRLLLGARYAMLRREFGAWSEWRRVIPPIGQRVLVTLGGSDPENVTLRVMEGLQKVRIEGLEITVAVGGSNPHLASLQSAIVGSSQPIRLLKDVTNMPELMAWADLAVAGAGATCWELCRLGVPALLIDLAPNQSPIARQLQELGMGIHVGAADVSPDAIAEKAQWALGSSEAREGMSRAGRELVDGAGALRVVTQLQVAK